MSDPSPSSAVSRLTRRGMLRGQAVAAGGAAVASRWHASGIAAAAPVAADATTTMRNILQAKQAGGTAIYYIGQEGAHIFPSFSSFSTVIEPSAPFFNGLTRPGLEREPTPDLAESWTSATMASLHLHPARWVPGTTVSPSPPPMSSSPGRSSATPTTPALPALQLLLATGQARRIPRRKADEITGVRSSTIHPRSHAHRALGPVPDHRRQPVQRPPPHPR